MAAFNLKTNVNNDRTAKIIATFPVDVPEVGAVKGDPFPLDTVQEVWFTGKRRKADVDADAVIVKKLSEGSIVVDDTNDNIAYVTITRADLAPVRPLTSDLALFCDVQVREATGEIMTVAEGKWKFTQSITQGA